MQHQVHLSLTPLALAEALRNKRGFVWLDSLLPQVSFSQEAHQEGLSLLAAEPDLLLEGTAQEWSLLEQELQQRTAPVACNQGPAGAAIGYFRYDGSYCFGFYEKIYRHLATPTASHWLTPLPDIETKKNQNEIKQEPLFFQSDLTAQEYCEKVQQAQEQIAAGNIYQICLAHRFTAPFRGDPWPLYLKLRKKNPAPFAAYLQLGKEKILSSSPECFLKIQGNEISTHPIKGTRPRGKTREEDEQQKRELQHSLKEKAELIMITDLERNDLGQICEYGSITTPELLELKAHPHVFHLVSTIKGKLRHSISHVAALAACFPGGSISGAPKKKAMEIIQQLEPVPRGLFTGAIGYFGFDGTSQFSIAIRTMTIEDHLAKFYVGAGITSDSIPQEEWEETLHKAAGILEATS